jgi:hypothetical protein
MTLTIVSAGGHSITLNELNISGYPSYRAYGGFRKSTGTLDGLGNYTGVPVNTLCNLVGGLYPSEILRVTAGDGYQINFTYSQINGDFLTYNNVTGQPELHNETLTTMLAYYFNDQPLTSGGPLRFAIVGPEGLLTPSKYWVQNVVKMEILGVWRDLGIVSVVPTMTEGDTTDYDAYQTTNDYYESPGYGLLSVIVVVQNYGTVTESYNLTVWVNGTDYWGFKHDFNITPSAIWFYDTTYPSTLAPGTSSGQTNWFLFDISYGAQTSVALFGTQINKPVPPGQYNITATLTDPYDQDPTNNVKSVPFGLHGSVEAFAMQGFSWHGWNSGTTTFWGMMMNLDNTTAVELPSTEQGEYAYMEFTIVNAATGVTTVLDSPVSYLTSWQWTFVSVSTTLPAGKYTCSYIVYFGNAATLTTTDPYPFFGQYSRTFKFVVWAPTRHHW